MSYNFWCRDDGASVLLRRELIDQEDGCFTCTTCPPKKIEMQEMNVPLIDF